MFKNLRPGQRVKYWAHGGLKVVRGKTVPERVLRSGKVVMVFASHAVLNAGGRHGTPAVVDDNNFHSA